jgi:hypothetical protein
MAVILGDPLAFDVRLKAEETSGQLAFVLRLRRADRTSNIQGQIGHSNVLPLAIRE